MSLEATRREENDSLIREYSEFLHTVELLDEDFLSITTLEGLILVVKFTHRGWTIYKVSGSVNNTDIHEDSAFETSEALLMAASKQFGVLFGDKLMEKLNQL